MSAFLGQLIPPIITRYLAHVATRAATRIQRRFRLFSFRLARWRAAHKIQVVARAWYALRAHSARVIAEWYRLRQWKSLLDRLYHSIGVIRTRFMLPRMVRMRYLARLQIARAAREVVAADRRVLAQQRRLRRAVGCKTAVVGQWHAFATLSCVTRSHDVGSGSNGDDGAATSAAIALYFPAHCHSVSVPVPDNVRTGVRWRRCTPVRCRDVTRLRARCDGNGAVTWHVWTHGLMNCVRVLLVQLLQRNAEGQVDTTKTLAELLHSVRGTATVQLCSIPDGAACVDQYSCFLRVR